MSVSRTVQESARVAVAVRLKDPEREAIARSNLTEARIADAIERALSTAPPLNKGQISRLSTLLRTGGVK